MLMSERVGAFSAGVKDLVNRVNGFSRLSFARL
jgi:hypothetical protein